jgi:hypothetical protein
MAVTQFPHPVPPPSDGRGRIIRRRTWERWRPAGEFLWFVLDSPARRQRSQEEDQAVPGV